MTHNGSIGYKARASSSVHLSAVLSTRRNRSFSRRLAPSVRCAPTRYTRLRRVACLIPHYCPLARPHGSHASLPSRRTCGRLSPWLAAAPSPTSTSSSSIVASPSSPPVAPFPPPRILFPPPRAPSSPTPVAPSPHQCLRARLSLSLPLYVAIACFNCFTSFILML